MAQRKIRNMEEFASVSGISRPTLSKYFNDPDSVRQTTRKRIEKALDQHDYRPNVFAMNQNRRTTKNIGIVVPYLADPFFTEIGRAVEMARINAGYSPILLSSHGNPDLEKENLESLRALKPAGVLLAPFGRASDRKTIQKFGQDVPLVLFDANISETGEAFIGTDNFQSVGLIVEYLCRSGEPPCFFEMKTPSNPNAIKRQQAYRESMERHGYPAHIFQAEGDGWNFEEIGSVAGGAMLASQTFPTNTVLCSNDRLAIGMLSAAYGLGIRVGLGSGCSLRIAGHDDHPFSRYTCPPLTTIAQDYTAIAERSVSTLFRIIEAGKPPSSRVETFFEGKLVMRDSA
jgi:DNA-binding LacI/PurR family transcriptional regulator